MLHSQITMLILMILIPTSHKLIIISLGSLQVLLPITMDALIVKLEKIFFKTTLITMEKISGLLEYE